MARSRESASIPASSFHKTSNPGTDVGPREQDYEFLAAREQAAREAEEAALREAEEQAAREEAERVRKAQEEQWRRDQAERAAASSSAGSAGRGGRGGVGVRGRGRGRESLVHVHTIKSRMPRLPLRKETKTKRLTVNERHPCRRDFFPPPGSPRQRFVRRSSRFLRSFFTTTPTTNTTNLPTDNCFLPRRLLSQHILVNVWDPDSRGRVWTG